MGYYVDDSFIVVAKASADEKKITLQRECSDEKRAAEFDM